MGTAYEPMRGWSHSWARWSMLWEVDVEYL